MRTFSASVALGSLFLGIALVPAVGAAVFTMVLFGLFFLALVGVVASVEDKTVRQRSPSMNATKWRDGSDV
jgi:hypothetical protein